MEGIQANIRGAHLYNSPNGDRYIVYVIRVTVHSPFHCWEIIRRFSDFYNLYKYMTQKHCPRKLPYEIPKLQPHKHILSYISPLGEAIKRIPKLQRYITCLLELTDLTMNEIDILKTFLNYEEYTTFLDETRNSMNIRPSQDSDFGVITNLDDITQVSRVLFLEAESRLSESHHPPDPDEGEDVMGIWRTVPGDSDSEHKECDDTSDNLLSDPSIGPGVVHVVSSDSLTTAETMDPSLSLDYRPTIDQTTFTAKRELALRGDLCTPQETHYSFSADRRSRVYAITSDGLKEAVKNNDMRGVRELLGKNPRLASYADSAGNPIIYSAALYGSVELSLVLIDAGADPLTKNRNGLCALDIALEPWKQAVMRYMVKKQVLLQHSKSNVSITASLTKSLRGLGMRLGRSPDGRAVIVGFKDMAGEDNPALTCSPPLAICDVLCAVNSIACPKFEVAIELIQDVPVGETVEIRISRCAV